MHRALRRTFAPVALCLVAATGCRNEADDNVARYKGFSEKMAGVVTRHAGDCTRMGQELDALMAESESMLREVSTYVSKLTPDEMRTFDEKTAGTIPDRAKVTEAHLGCMSDAAVMAATQRMYRAMGSTPAG